MKNMLATIKDIIEGLEDRVEISLFIICAGLVIAAVFGFATLLLCVMYEYPIVAIVLLISFGIPAFAVLYTKHSKKNEKKG